VSVQGSILFDKHLISDEPVIPQPMSRPRSYSDLDAIPDDYD